ncbi:hypothetical protein MTP99_006970 [Tenebrio molitor]|nr:hypothetical protein MTP99_006970 [Tenebrio molitor]
MTLPPTYKYFISAWESTSSDQRTLANLISRLTAEESRMSTENPENVAFASTKVNWNKPVLKGTCNYCKKPGHINNFHQCDIILKQVREMQLGMFRNC